MIYRYRYFIVSEQLTRAVLNEDNIKPQWVIQHKCFTIFLKFIHRGRNLMATAGSGVSKKYMITISKSCRLETAGYWS